MSQDANNAPSLFKFDGLENRLDSFKEDTLVFAPMKDGVMQIAKIVACRIMKGMLSLFSIVKITNSCFEILPVILSGASYF